MKQAVCLAFNGDGECPAKRQPNWERGSLGCRAQNALNHKGRDEMFLKKLVIAGAALCLMKSAAFAADCGPSGQSIRILASDFPAIHAVAGTAEELSLIHI